MSRDKEREREGEQSWTDDDIGDGESIRVAVRVRPFNAREVARGCKCCVEMAGQKTTLLGRSDRSGDGRRDFTFDHCYWSHDRSSANFASQEKVFGDLGRFALSNAFKGYNVCLFAYGQTGSGKSYSMVGSPEDRGIVPRVAAELFEYITSKKDDNVAFEVATSMIEIYKEKISDLLNQSAMKPEVELKVREHPKSGPYVEGLTALTASSYSEIERQLAMGNRNKSVAATHMNDVSSRAHTIFSIKFSQTELEQLSGDESHLARETKKVSHINLVDLAGSERQTSKQLSTSEQMRFKEGIAINKSLSALANCIFALYKQSQSLSKDKVHVPYRDSQLTWLLKESLGGNAKTIMLAAISPADINFEESLSTLQYASRAKRIKTNAIVNEDTNDRIIRELRAEIERLRKEVAGQHKPPVAVVQTAADEEVQRLRAQLEESQRMIETMSLHWQEQLKEQALKKSSGGLSVSGKGLYIDDQNCPHLVNLNEDPLMTECLVYFLAPGQTVVGSDVQEDESKGGHKHTIALVGQTIAPQHCAFHNDQGQVFIEAIMGAVTFVNGRRVSERLLLHQGNRIVIGTSHIFRFNDPVEAARVRRERDEYLKLHPNEMDTAPAVIDWTYAVDELRAMSFKEENRDRDRDKERIRGASRSTPEAQPQHSPASSLKEESAKDGAGDLELAGRLGLVQTPSKGGKVGHGGTGERDSERESSGESEESEGGELEALGESGEEEEESEEDELVELEALDDPEISSETLRAAMKSPPTSPPSAHPMQPTPSFNQPHRYPESAGDVAESGGVSRDAPMAGIGVLVQRLGGMITVVDLVDGGPAHVSGELKIGQVVLEVDGQAVDQLSFKNVLQIIRGPVGSTISLMVQDVQDVGRGVKMVKMRRGLLPDAGVKSALPAPSPSDRETEMLKQHAGGHDDEESEDEEDEDEEDEAFDLTAMDVKGRAGSMRSEMVGERSDAVEKEEDESADESDEMLNLEQMDETEEDFDSDASGEDLEALESFQLPAAAADSVETKSVPSSAALPARSHAQAPASSPTTPNKFERAAPAMPTSPTAPLSSAGEGVSPNRTGGQQQPPLPPSQQEQHKNAPLCIKIDVEPTNRQNAGYSLMFNVEKVATGLRYGVEIKDRKTMLKVYHRCFGGAEAVEWLTLHSLQAFMEKENCDMTQPPNERLRILARSAALLLAQRLLETEVFRQINKSKGGQNVFEDPQSLFRFREDEKAGPVLNTRHVWNCRARPPVVVAADLVHKALVIHLDASLAMPQPPGGPDETLPGWLAFLQVAEELQMVDISLLFRRAEVAFFLNLHNALMLHTHLHRGTVSGEGLRTINSRLLKLHQYRVGGQFYYMETMQQRLLKAKAGARGGGVVVEPRLHFALSLGCISSPDVRVYTVDNLDDELTLATASMCERDVQVNCDMHGVKTVVLPKVFKWFAKDFGDDKLASLTFIAHHLEQAQGVSPAGRDLARELRAILQSGDGKAPGRDGVRIKFSDFDWRKRAYGRPP